ncbi:release factor glutamine methyltransferase [Saonia flava]|uniref:Release factor glutamine methyltransferase n=1 Tax=Saonia flava TaxID=523696 RepID=A0A846QTI0_9FLAO|nr:peptide chain release factor N(5)-glutamine methyltransferase [Saonia flava]NJB70537.1 release factor glutamine methyltransferase [Saonia flava]
MQLKEIKNIFHAELDTLYPIEEVDSFFYWMISHYLGLERFVLAIEPNLTITKEEEQPLFEGLSQLKLEIPIQYIIGETEFLGLKFSVNENVLIPRPETEELVRWMIQEISKQKSKCRILDVGTGSGCIAVSLAKNLPEAQVYALDVSKNALEVAIVNAEINEVNINFIEANIMELESLGDKFDVIVSNPPYVRELEKEEMKTNVLNNEPELALFVSNENPLQFYKAIVQFAKINLNESGVLYFEINQYLGEETKQLLLEENFSEIELRKDIYGNDRMLKGTKMEHN